MDKRTRVELFYKRLTDCPPSSTHDECYALICSILNAVEDEFSGVTSDPDNWQTDGRLYPPKKDSVRNVNGFPEVVRYRSANHNTFIASNGAIEVQQIDPEEVQFRKAGANGKEVWDVQN